MIATRTSPRPCFLCLATLISKSEKAARRAVASFTKASPCGVNLKPPRPRLQSVYPSLASNAAISVLIVDCARFSTSCAAENPPL